MTTPGRLGRLLGVPPVPEGSWRWEAALLSAVPVLIAAGRPAPAGLLAPGRLPRPAHQVAEEIAARLRAVPGVEQVRVRPDGLLFVVLGRPGEIVREILTSPAAAAVLPGPAAVPPSTWPDSPRTWDNPGFVLRFAYARAAAVRRWARALGVPCRGFRPELLDHPCDRAVLRVLAELPSRAASRDPAWADYAERLAAAYHDAHEQASAIPSGDASPAPVHTARLRLAEAVQRVLAGLVGPGLPDRM